MLTKECNEFMDGSFHIETIESGIGNEIETNKAARAFAAFRLDSIGAAAHDNRERLDFLSRFMSRQIDFIATLPAIGPRAALEVRLTSLPVEAAPQRGEIRVALRVRAEAETPEQASEALLQAVDCVHPNLVAISDAYQWRPVSSEAEYKTLFEAFEPRYVSELVRREAQLPLDRLEALPPKRPIGFINNEPAAPQPTSETESDVYYVFPYVRTYSSLKTLCNVLLMDNQPVSVSFALKPTRVRNSELDILSKELERCEIFLGNGHRYGSNDLPTGSPLRHRAQVLLGALHNFTFSLLDDCFHGRTSVASAAPVSSGLMETLGTAVSESVSSRDPYSDAGNEGQVLKGGYEWMHAESPENYNKALNNLTRLEFDAWIPSVARPGAERLRYLADARQANSVFRLPVPVPGNFPGLRTRMARLTPPPSDLPRHGLFLGDNAYRGIPQPVHLLRDDRRRHMYMVGQTGTGKSTLLKQMIMQDIINGEGVGVMDPHGELVDQVLQSIPPERVQDVVYIDPTDPKRSIGLNPLQFRDELDRDSSINHLMEIFEQLYDMQIAGGPIFEKLLRNSVMLANPTNQSRATLLAVSRLFEDNAFRRRMLSECPDPMVRSYWKNTLLKTSGEYDLANFGAYVTAKFARITSNTLMKHIVLQPESTIDFLQCMDEQKIVLVDLAKGKLGDTNSRFLGMVLLSLITRAVFARSQGPATKPRKDFYLYVDEFQNLATGSFSTILSEARKYGLNLTVTNQYLHQIPKDRQDAVIGNVGTILSFRTGLQDAQLLETRYANGVSQHDLMALENYHAYLVTLIKGNATRVFDVETRNPDYASDPRTARAVRVLSNRKYTRSRKSVEQAVRRFMEDTQQPSNKNATDAPKDDLKAQQADALKVSV